MKINYHTLTMLIKCFVSSINQTNAFPLNESLFSCIDRSTYMFLCTENGSLLWLMGYMGNVGLWYGHMDKVTLLRKIIRLDSTAEMNSKHLELLGIVRIKCGDNRTEDWISKVEDYIGIFRWTHKSMVPLHVWTFLSDVYVEQSSSLVIHLE